MFGDDNNQQLPTENSNGDAFQAAIPDPIADASLGGDNGAGPDSAASAGAPAMPSYSDSDGDTSSIATADTPDPVSVPATDVPDDLSSLKQQALQHLSPLVNHLDQTPEERFRTTMMMIQASDDQSLIKSAFEAAQKITDDKSRAQALLDVINEINYFTQSASPTNASPTSAEA